MPAAEQVKVQMVHCLPSIVPCVDDDPVAIVQRLFPCDLRRCSHQMTHQRSVFCQSLCRRGYMLLGDNQQVSRCLGVDVGEANAQIVFVYPVSRNRSVDDLAKKTVGRGGGARLCLHG